MKRRTRVLTLSIVVVLAAVAGARELWFQYALSRAQSLLDNGDAAAAEQGFERALTIKSGSVKALVGRAVARERGHGARAALLQLRDAVAQHRGEPLLHVELAHALAREGAAAPSDRQRALYDEAAMAYKRAAALRPDDAELLNDIGLDLRAIGQTELAIAMFRKAAAIDPGWGGPELNLGDTFRDAERYQEAVEILQLLENRAVKVPAYRVQNALAQVYLDWQKPREAERVLRRAVALNAEYSAVRISLALALLDQRRYSEATTELEVANRLDPQSGTVFLMCQLYALQERAEDVLHCLGQAIAAGIPVEVIRAEPLFRFIQDRSEYHRLIATGQAR
jgi:tetratricopeptide (TPR) repeat protein